TDLTLHDIYPSDKDEVFISGSNSSTLDGILLKGSFNAMKTFVNSDVSNIGNIENNLVGELATVWLERNGTIYTGGNEIFWHKNSQWNYLNSLKNVERGFIKSIRGNAGNDIFLVGYRNTLLHFNGIDWKHVGIDFDPASPIILNKVEIKNNLAVAVGRYNRQAIIIILKR
ncbi:MAG: hypothetical protein KKB34_19960, partial [Bacteroidetes bacterium]|nr:hypothetical protein [Bacteroidota bacterium]